MSLKFNMLILDTFKYTFNSNIEIEFNICNYFSDKQLHDEFVTISNVAWHKELMSSKLEKI